MCSRGAGDCVTDSFRVLSVGSGILPATVRTGYPRCACLPMYSGMVTALGGKIMNTSVSNSGPSSVAFSFSGFLISPASSLISSVFVSCSYRIAGLGKLLKPVPSVAMMFGSAGFPGGVGFPTKACVFGHLAGALSKFRCLQIVAMG